MTEVQKRRRELFWEVLYPVFFEITYKLGKNIHSAAKYLTTTYNKPGGSGKMSKCLLSALIKTNHARLQKLLSNELGQEHVLKQKTGCNLAIN